MNHLLKCRCGTLKGSVGQSARVNRCICYCRDCQAFAHFLGRADETLDAQGGTDIVQTLPATIAFTQGVDALACMRLTENGLLRWYSACCSTPIGNTLANYKISFIGLVHDCLNFAGGSMDHSFGPVRMWVHTKNATAKMPSNSLAAVAGMARFAAMLARARIDGSYKRTPFFNSEKGTPVATPKVLTQSELQRVMNAVQSKLVA